MKKSIKILFVFIVLFTFNQTLFSKIYIYKSEENKIHLSNTLEENNQNKYIENFDKYQLIYADDSEIEEEQKKNEKFESLDMQAKNEFKYDKLIFEASKKYNVEFILIKTIMKTLTEFDENYSKDNKFGIMGIQEDWVDKEPKDISVKENIFVGTEKLKSLLIEFDYNLQTALAAYFLNSEIVNFSLEQIGTFPTMEVDCYNFVTDCISTYKNYQSENPEIKNNIKRHFGEDGKSMIIFNTDVQPKK